MDAEQVTYKMADGSLIWGEYSYVHDLEFFDEADDPCELVKETWRLVKSERIKYPERDYGDEDEED